VSASTEPARVALPAVMRGPAVRRVLAALAAEGAEVRFVGGCVRDALAGRAVKDIDLASPDPPARTMALLRAAGLKAVPTGVAHGTVTAVADGQGFEVTTLRVDVRTFGRHAEVAFTDDWTADAARRDFTFNAMSASPDGTLYDYFGGRRDLAAGRVRFVGDAATRIAEDYLRVLRFFRFIAHFARTGPDEAALAACGAAAGSLDRLSGERVRNELLKLLAAPDPVPALRFMAGTGVLAAILPESGAFDRLAALVGVDDGDPLRRLAALVGAGGGTVGERLRLSNAERARLERTDSLDVAPGRAAPEIRRLLYRHGAVAFADAVLLAWATRLAAGTAADGLARAYGPMLEAARTWIRPALPIKGRDAIAAGVSRGPRVNRLVHEIEDWWEAGDFTADRAQCLAELARRARAT
jgi:poly(A) polymerase